MNSKDQSSETGDGEASSASAVTSSETPAPSTSSSVETETMKRAAAKKLIERYFYQLTEGCGNAECDNEFCASSGKVKNLTPNQAAAQAIQLFSQEARLCDSQPSKVPRTQSNNKTRIIENESSPFLPNLVPPTGGDSNCAILNSQNVQGSSIKAKEVPFLTEEKLLTLLDSCKSQNSYSPLIRTLGEVYSNTDALNASFQRTGPESSLDVLLDKAPPDLKSLKKEDVRALEGETDKDQDDEAGNETGEELHVDLSSLRRAYKALFEVPNQPFESALVNALVTLAGNLELDLKAYKDARPYDPVSVLMIVMEIPVLGNAEYLDRALPYLCKAASHLTLSMQARLAKLWAKYCRPRLRCLLQALHQLITVRVISGHFTRDFYLQDDDGITAPTKVMKILYYASILAGDLDPPDLRKEEAGGGGDDPLLGELAAGKSPRTVPQEDPLAVELQVNVLDSRKPYLPFIEFYNEPLSDAVEMDKDFAYYKSDSGRKFSFMNYSFILTPATKTLGLYYDNRIRMYSERRISLFNAVVGQPTNPYLRLKVKRDRIIDDALVELELIAMESPKDLKKQLVVEFDGEQGIDEGGVSKEFFQLIVEEIFNPDYGMFTFNQDTQTFWFNPTSFESNAQFTLIGIVLGLAIYNNIILDVHFPMVVYKKLMGKKGTFYDLEDFNKTLYSGLQNMMEYEQDDMEDVFVQTFRISYQDVFGSTYYHELKEGGDQIFVTQDNKREFVDLYADFLLNVSIEKQFRAFRRGFQMVTDESPLHLLFRPEEVEQLVCGSKNFDFSELQEATEYDGYTAESAVIKNFWEIVHNMPLEDKRKLLQFATGSDRVPVGGLSKLKLIIARHGPDSDRLPTAHTCFNVLLLPEYETKEKLNDRLVKAINYSKGFGML